MARPRPASMILIALAGAIGFVLIRVGYRVAFGGAGGGETAVWEIPTLRLWGPFSHIVLGGEVTAEGLVASVTSGVPFALVILVSGTLLAFFDPRSIVLFVPRLRAGKSVALAFVISLSTLPFLVTTVRHTRHSARRRGITPGRQLVLPILEKTLERAVGIAEALYSRGIASHPRKSLSPTASPVGVTNLTVPGRGITSLSWSISQGEQIVLTGATGCGKTTLLRAFAGLLPIDPATVFFGEVHVGAGHVAYLPHDPYSLFLAGSVADEIALSWVLRGYSPSSARTHALEALESWELADLSAQHPAELSSGEAVVVALITLLATQPDLLLLDEPLQALDASWRARVMNQLHALAGQGITVVVSDHGSPELEGWGEFFAVGPGGIQPGRYVSPRLEYPRLTPVPPVEPEVVADFVDLSANYGSRRVLNQVSLQIHRGQTTVITGDNGSGKTTLLETCADQNPGQPQKFALVPAEPADMFVKDSLAEELAYADTVAGARPGLTQETLESLLSGSWRETIRTHMGTTHPRDLSRGQQTAVAIAIQLSHKPLVLALDEPTRGLDEAAILSLREVIGCVKETGVALLVATHQPAHFEDLSHHAYELSGGQLRKSVVIKR